MPTVLRGRRLRHLPRRQVALERPVQLARPAAAQRPRLRLVARPPRTTPPPATPSRNELRAQRRGDRQGDDYSAPFVAKEATTWLKTKRDPAKPFFLAVWTHEPHYPIASAERYEKLHSTIADQEERTYRANVTQLDDAFGMLMKTLDDVGAADSTRSCSSRATTGPRGMA
jgi:hypothetical protein